MSLVDDIANNSILMVMKYQSHILAMACNYDLR